MDEKRSRKIRVLYIEDDPADVELAKKALEHTCVEVEYELIVGDHGDHAIDLLRDPHFDLIMLDHMLPRMSGIEILEHIRSNPNLKHLPVILLSGSDFQAEEKTRQLGVNAIFRKPLDFQSFKSTFRDICREWFIPISQAKAG